MPGAPRRGRPIVLHVEDDRPRSLAALTIFDVLLVNPVRDGLNLVAKEGSLLNGGDGVLVLSHEAGAWEELSEAALGVNPFDVAGTADALHRALSMDPAERPEPRRPPAVAGAGPYGGGLAGRPARRGGAAAHPLTTAARASCSSSATAPAGPSTTRSDCAGHPVVALGVDHGDPGHRHPRAAQLRRGGEGRKIAEVVAEDRHRPHALDQRRGPRCPCPRRAGA